MVSMRLLSPANRARFNALSRDQRREFREFADGERTSPDAEEARDLLNAHFDRWMSEHHAAEASVSPLLNHLVMPWVGMSDIIKNVKTIAQLCAWLINKQSQDF